MIIPYKYSAMAKSMKRLDRQEMTKILFLLDNYMKIAMIPSLERFYENLDRTTKEQGPMPDYPVEEKQ